MTEAGPLVQLQISVTRTAWRLAPAWAVLAGAVAVMRLPLGPTDGLRMAGAVVLGDLVWGMLRRGTEVHAASTGIARAPDAPYGQPAAPLSRLVQTLGTADVSWQSAVAGVALALGGGFLFGWAGLLLSLAALTCILVGWSIASQGRMPAACHAALDVLLPWVLGIVAADGLGGGAAPWEAMVIGAAFALLQWGYLRTTQGAIAGSPLPLVLGMGCVISVLVALGWPRAAALVAVLFAPVAYWFAGAASDESGGRRAAWAAPALYLALFVAAFALRQSA